MVDAGLAPVPAEFAQAGRDPGPGVIGWQVGQLKEARVIRSRFSPDTRDIGERIGGFDLAALAISGSAVPWNFFVLQHGQSWSQLTGTHPGWVVVPRPV